MNCLFCCSAVTLSRVSDANALQVGFQSTVACPQPEDSSLVASLEVVDGICSGVVVTSAPLPFCFSFVLKQCLCFWIGGWDRGLRLFAARLSKTISPFISWDSAMGGDPLQDCGALLW